MLKVIKNRDKKMKDKLRSELIVALDFSSQKEALSLINQLEGLPVTYKIGSELFLAAGPSFVESLVHQGENIFLDLKFYDIPNTVLQAAKRAAQLGVKMFTVHLSGGQKMLESLTQEFSDLVEKPKVLGVSVLTSFDEQSWADWLQLNGSIKGVSVLSSVSGLVKAGVDCGIDGVVCSAFELETLKKLFPDLYTVVPGIRLNHGNNADQSRVMTPAQASGKGASAIVVGRPITQSETPRAVVENIIKELSFS